MIVLVSLIVLLRRLLPLFFAWCIPTSPFIHPRRTCAGELQYLYFVCVSVATAMALVVCTLKMKYSETSLFWSPLGPDKLGGRLVNVIKGSLYSRVYSIHQ